MHLSEKPSMRLASSLADSRDPDEITFIPPIQPLTPISLDEEDPDIITPAPPLPSSSSSSLSPSSPSSSPSSPPFCPSTPPPPPPPTTTTTKPPIFSTPTSDPERDNSRELECTICSYPIGHPLPPAPFTTTKPRVECAVTLPCGHVYGDLCITKWLEKKSLHQDCPDCRRRMVHKGCGHFVVPRRVGRAPRVLGWGGKFSGYEGEVGGEGKWDWDGEGGLEGECLRCRGSRVVAEMVRGEKERLETQTELEAKVVKGLWEGLRSAFGLNGGGSGIGGRNGSKGGKERVEERRREFERVWDGAWEVWEREEGMRRW